MQNSNWTEKTTDIKKYFDADCNQYRYVKIEFRFQKDDPKCFHITEYHTIPVSESTSFTQAANESISFREGINMRDICTGLSHGTFRGGRALALRKGVNIPEIYTGDSYSDPTLDNLELNGYDWKYSFEDKSKYVNKRSYRRSSYKELSEKRGKEELYYNLKLLLKFLLLFPFFAIRQLINLMKKK